MANESESTVHTNQMKNNPQHPGTDTLNPLSFIKSSSNRDRYLEGMRMI